MTDLNRFIRCLKDGSREECFALAREEEFPGASVTDKYEQLLIPALNAIGQQWESNESSIVDEHFASEIVQDIVAYDAVRLTPSRANGRTVLMGCVPMEQHSLASKMMANRLTEQGWTVRYYGASVPAPDLLRRIDDLRPDLILLSMRSLELLDSTISLLTQLRDRHPSIRLMLGGVRSEDVRTVLQRHIDAFADDFATAAETAERITST